MNIIFTKQKIGIVDSGIGGLTVLKELIDKNTQSEICYICDINNVPFGNKSKNDILNLSKEMFSFLIKKENIQDIIIACNTMSSLVADFKKSFNQNFYDIISPTCKYINKNKIQRVGLLATEFTIKSKVYENYLGKKEIFSQDSKYLATLIETNFNDKSKIKQEIINCIDKINMCDYIILGCTHYPIVIDIFEECYPKINFINPSKIFCENLKSSKKQSKVKIYTTQKSEELYKLLKKLNINYDKIIQINLYE